MKKTWILLTAALLITLMPAPAQAKKGGNKPPRDQLVASTCAERYVESTPVTIVNNSFTLSLNGRDSGACVDLGEVPAGIWEIEVTVGSASSVQVDLRDGIPGDWCWVEVVEADSTLEFDTPESGAGVCPFGGANGESILDEGEPFSFTAGYRGGKHLAIPVTVKVTLPGAA